MTNLPESELDKIFQHGHPLGDPRCEICHMWEQTKNLIAQEANKARISELKQLEPPEQYEEYAKLMGSEQCNICGFNALEFRRHIQERIKALTADKEVAE